MLHDSIVENIDDFSLNDEFKVLIEACHLVGIKVIMDFIPRVTARDSNIIWNHPDWFYWIKKTEEKFEVPYIPNIEFFQECTKDNIEQVYNAESTRKFLEKFVESPDKYMPDVWSEITSLKDREDLNILSLIEDKMGITTAPAHSDWINDVQPIWTDITFWKLYIDNNPMVESWIGKKQAPYVLFDTIKANKFPCKIPNVELWNMLIDIIRYYIYKFDLDGFRFDIGHTLPKDLLESIFFTIKEVKEDAIFISEDLFCRNHKNAARTGYNIMLGSSWNEVANLSKDSYMDFLSEMASMDILAYACAETHDTPRIVSRLGGNELARAYGIVNAFLPNGINFILSGYEVNEKKPMNCGLADNNSKYNLKKAFFDNIVIDWNNNSAEDMVSYISKVNKIRLELCGVINKKNFELINVSREIVAFAYADRNILVLFNVSTENAIGIDLNDFNIKSKYTILMNSSNPYAEKKMVEQELTINPVSSILLRKEEGE